MDPLEIKIALMRAKVKQAEIAIKCGVSATQVLRVIGGSKSMHVRQAIAVAISKPVNEIWPDHPNKADSVKNNI